VQVDVEGNLVNAYVSSKTPGRVELERIGNLRDIKEIPIAGIADIKLDGDGTVMWAFTDSEEPLRINPLALMQQDSDVRHPTSISAQIPVWKFLSLVIACVQGDVCIFGAKDTN
jgi:hypothetical protein